MHGLTYTADDVAHALEVVTDVLAASIAGARSPELAARLMTTRDLLRSLNIPRVEPLRTIQIDE